MTTQTYIQYAQIPTTAISQITDVIINDEGGWKFNDEAGGDWNYAGMLSSNFIEAYKTIKPALISSKSNIQNQFLDEPDGYKRQLTIELYYNKFYLPALIVYNNVVNDNADSIPLIHLSCAINCGLGAFNAILSDYLHECKAVHVGTIYFTDAWEDHYIKLVVDNAVAWRDYGVAITNYHITHPTARDNFDNITIPHPLRATNLQGWINRVRRYRDGS